MSSMTPIEELDEIDTVKRAVEEAESRARTSRSKLLACPLRSSDKQIAESLHAEGDVLLKKGHYESALILYYRAAKLQPRDVSHEAAAKRTSDIISLWDEENKTGVAEIEKTIPETISQVYRLVEERSKTPRTKPAKSKLHRAGMAMKHSNALAASTLKSLEASFNSGNMDDAIERSRTLLSVASDLREPIRYEIAAYHYLALIHTALNRHDKAVDNAARMLRLSLNSDDDILICRALTTLGMVHLNFKRFNAAAIAWSNSLADVKEPIIRAWIQHEIGRCYLEMSRYTEALDMATKCIRTSEEIDAEKWLCYGKLLKGQCLAMLGRFAESLESLSGALNGVKETGNESIIDYIEDLIDRVGCALRSTIFDKDGNIVAPAITDLSERSQKLKETKNNQVEDIESEKLTSPRIPYTYRNEDTTRTYVIEDDEREIQSRTNSVREDNDGQDFCDRIAEMFLNGETDDKLNDLRLQGVENWLDKLELNDEDHEQFWSTVRVALASSNDLASRDGLAEGLEAYTSTRMQLDCTTSRSWEGQRAIDPTRVISTSCCSLPASPKAECSSLGCTKSTPK